MIRYSVRLMSPKAHIFEVTLTLNLSKSGNVRLRLPAWIPGSYMIRDFARHIVSMSGTCDGVEVELKQVNKHSWDVMCQGNVLEVMCQVYAFDLSVRGAYLDHLRGFFNGSCLFLVPDGFAEEACELTILPPSEPEFKGWQVATALAVKQVKGDSGFGVYAAKNYAELIDCPVEIGAFERFKFTAEGVPHELVLSGKYSADINRLVKDMKAICSAQIRLFKGQHSFDSYVFLLHVADESVYGGLEHRSSTSLLANRMNLPAFNMKDLTDDYVQLLGLISHEYFHAWNVKAIKPQVFEYYDLNQEVYTEQLWIFEGITSYYDDLMLLRSKIINKAEYLDLLAKNITRVYRGNGRTKQSLAESSFNAWAKYYKQDENSPNSIVSYYQKGALLALCLDLLIRKESLNQLSLDDVMNGCYQDFRETNKGLPEGIWQRKVEDVTGLDLKGFFEQAVYGTSDLPLISLFKEHGMVMNLVAMPDSCKGGFGIGETPNHQAHISLGARWHLVGSLMRLTHVLDHGAAQNAGLSAGDEIVAIDGFKLSHLEKQLSRFSAGDCVPFYFFRQGILMMSEVTFLSAPANCCFLSLADSNLPLWLHQEG